MRAFLRWFFRLLYHSFAWSYDLVSGAVSVGRWNNWVRAAARLLSGPRILELGYGPGHLQVYLHDQNLSTFGLDESAQMARQAFRRLRRQGRSPKLTRGLAQHLPFASASFDSVVATFPTPYITDPETLAEIQRVLKPSQRLVVLMAAWITGKSLLDRLMRTIFRITAEAPPEDQDLSQFIEPYRQAGFQASIRFVELPGSRLMFILAVRPITGSL